LWLIHLQNTKRIIMVLPSATATAAASQILQLAKSIVSPTTAKSQLAPLLFKLAQRLTESSEQHLLTSRVPRVPRKHDFPAPSMSIEAALRSIEEDRSSSLKTSLPQPFLSSTPTPTTTFSNTNSRTTRSTSTSPSSNSPLPLPLSAANSTYGETPPETIRDMIATLLDRHNLKQSHFSGHFIDVGSGNGSVVLSAALTERFHGTYRGVEYDPIRQETSLLLKSKYENHYQNRSTNTSPTSTPTTTATSNRTTCTPSSVEFFCNDIRTIAPTFLDGASVVFANCVVWDANLCGALGQLLDDANFRPHALVVSMSRRFPSPTFNLVDILTLPANNGGHFTFYVCQKVSNGCSSKANSKINSSNGTTTSTKEGVGSLAISDAPLITMLLQGDDDEPEKKNGGGLLVEALIESSLKCDQVGTSGMTFLTSLASSESATRILLRNQNLLPEIATQLGLWESDKPTTTNLARRANASMVLRAISEFPIGRREIAKSDFVVQALLKSLFRRPATKNCTKSETTHVHAAATPQLDHPLIRANVLDILGQVLYDPIGNQILEERGVDALLSKVLADATLAVGNNTSGGEFEVLEAGREAHAMRQWWQSCSSEQ
jgi:hypothetical protein